MEYLDANGVKENSGREALTCFEYVYEEDGVTFMDVYIHVDALGHANLYTPIR